MKNILITGATGHIGSYLIKNLGKTLGDLNIYILDNMSTGRYCSLFNLPNYSSYNFLHLDLTKCTINDIPKTDFVIHLAAKTDAAQSAKFKDEFYTNNLESTKKIIEYVWGHACPLSESFSIEGFEYWTGIQSPSALEDGVKDNLPTHFDKDEALHKKTGEIVTPIMGSVYYPPGQSFRGGDLAIYTEEGENPELIKAKPNRFIIFNAGEYLHEVTPVIEGVRHAIAINVWEKEPYSKQVGDLVVE